MKRTLSIFILCLLVTAASYNICNAQESGYKQSDQDASSASTDNFDGEIPEINEPVELWMFIENYRCVTGQMIQLTLQMMWQLGVSVDIDGFKQANLSPFVVEKMSIGERQIFNNDCDYRIITYLLSLPDEAEEGIYTIPPFFVSYRDEANKTDGKAKTAPFTLKKVSCQT